MCFCLHYMQDSSIWLNLEIPVENKVFVNKFIDWLLVPVRHPLHACLAFQWNKQQIPFPYKKSPVLIRNTNKSQEPSPQTHQVTFGFHPNVWRALFLSLNKFPRLCLAKTNLLNVDKTVSTSLKNTLTKFNVISKRKHLI